MHNIAGIAVTNLLATKTQTTDYLDSLIGASYQY